MSDVCRLCKRPIILEGKYWTHENGVTYRHTPRLMPKADAPPTDADRIAAAVAVLRGAADDNQYCWEVERALAILEGRAEGK